MKNIPFIKMHGLGNDFILFDFTKKSAKLTKKNIINLADRNKGVGCDQVIIMLRAKHKKNDVMVEIYNNDGSRVYTCGNAMRCVAFILRNKLRKKNINIETTKNVIKNIVNSKSAITSNMSAPKFSWKEIPLSRKMNTKKLNINLKNTTLKNPSAVNMGNPHMVFFTKNIRKINLKKIGPKLEKHNFFPKKCNVSIAQKTSENSIELKVWERGAGETLACGSAACATTVIAINKKIVKKRKVNIIMPGGKLKVEWNKANNVLMTGPAQIAFTGFVKIEN